LIFFLKALSASEFEVSSAATIDPNAVLVTSPGAAFYTGRVALLAHQANRSAIAHIAIMALHVTGFAVKVLNHTATITIIIAVAVAVTVTVTVTVAPVIAAGYKISAAASIHPDAATVKSPCPP
jgi:hypothetical protein